MRMLKPIKQLVVISGLQDFHTFKNAMETYNYLWLPSSSGAIKCRQLNALSWKRKQDTEKLPRSIDGPGHLDFQDQSQD